MSKLPPKPGQRRAERYARLAYQFYQRGLQSTNDEDRQYNMNSADYYWSLADR